MEFLFLIIVLGAIAAVIVKVLFWIFVGRVIIGAGKNAEAEFMQMMQQLDMTIRNAQQHPTPGGQVQLPPDFAAQLMRAQNQFTSMDRLAQQRHETFVSGMLSNASSAGIDVSGWNSNW